MSQICRLDGLRRRRPTGNCVRVLLGMGEADCNVGGYFHYNDVHSCRAGMVAHNGDLALIVGTISIGNDGPWAMLSPLLLALPPAPLQLI